ncbi:global transactivator [Fusarium agapanthi]|uniref:Global transactivator n=1 Tax=Fusarium agapanthi TaxID=1803897 RepID=A0A9P5AWK4_9HYPO|nr:global transactivator [Fusarium agapanthi]
MIVISLAQRSGTTRLSHQLNGTDHVRKLEAACGYANFPNFAPSTFDDDNGTSMVPEDDSQSSAINDVSSMMWRMNLHGSGETSFVGPSGSFCFPVSGHGIETQSTGPAAEETAAKIAAMAKRLEQFEPPAPSLTSRYWTGLLQPCEGFVGKRDTPNSENSEDVEQDIIDSDPDEDKDQENGSLEDRWTDALAVNSGYNEQEFISFFEQIHDDIVAKYRAPNPGPIPGLRDNCRLFDRQKRAVAAALKQKDSRFQGMILADPPGFGKTLSALATISVSVAKSGSTKGPCVIVTPLSCCRQWMAEIDRLFGQDQMPAICLARETLSPLDLWKYKVMVTSYSYVSAEVTQTHKFINSINDYKRDIITQPPQRPVLVLLH